MNLSIYSSGGWDGDFYYKKITKLGSNKEKAHQGLIWGIMLHYFKAYILFSIH